MYETRDMTNIPVIVVANKIDLVAAKNYVPPPVPPPPRQHHHQRDHHQHHHPVPAPESGNHLTVAGCSNILAISPLISLNGALTNGSGGHPHAHHPPEVGTFRDRKEISHLVTIFMNLIFGRKVSGNTSILKLWTTFRPKATT
jgi:hypothetical protein